MCFIWIAFRDGIRIEVSVLFVAKNGISVKWRKFLDMAILVLEVLSY